MSSLPRRLLWALPRLLSGGGGRETAWGSAGSPVRNEGLGLQLHDTEGDMDSRWAADGQGVVVFLSGSYCSSFHGIVSMGGIGAHGSPGAKGVHYNPKT